MSDISDSANTAPWAPRDFAIAVLRGLGAPTSSANISFLLSWFQREGVNPSYNNPLATTLKYGSYTNINSVGVKHYSDPSTGVAATIKTLQGSNYSGIVTDLKAGNAAGAAHNHPDEFTKWSGGGYDHIDITGDTAGGVTTTAAASTQATPSTALPPNASATDIEAYIRKNYPGEAGFLDVPEIRTILIDEAQKGGDENELSARIQGTQWWKDHSATTRNFLALKATDPAEAEAEVQRKMADIRSQYGFDNLGSDVSLRAIAEASLTYGWNDQQIKDNLAGHQEYDLAHTGLATGSVNEVEAQKLQQMATSEFFVPMDTQTAQQWAVNIYEGKATEDSYREYLSNLSEARFPGLKAQGITPGQYMAPIVNTIADTLEVQPGDVNLLDPKYSAVLSVQDPNGMARPMNLSEAQRWARSQPGYLITQGAKDTAANFAETLSQTFGKIA